MVAINVLIDENELKNAIIRFKYTRGDNLWWTSPNLFELVGVTSDPVSKLIDILSKNDIPDKSWKAGYLLGKMKAIEALPSLLVICREHKNPRIRGVAFWVIGCIHEFSDKIFPFLVKSLEKEKSLHTQNSILEAVDIMLDYHEISENTLYKLLSIILKIASKTDISLNEDLEAVIPWVFNHIADKELNKLIETIKTGTNYKLRLLIAKYFGELFNIKEIIPVLILVKQMDRSSKVREQAKLSLIKLARNITGKENLLNSIFEDENVIVRKEAAYILNSIGESSKKFQKTLIEATKHSKNELIKFDYIWLLAAMGEKEFSFKQYKEMLNNGELTASQIADFEVEFDPFNNELDIEIKKESTQTNDIEYFIRVLSDKDKIEERKEILYNFGNKVLELNSDKLTELLIKLLKNDSDSDLRRTIAQRFSYVKRLDVMESLCDALLNDNDSWVRHDAARALGTLDFIEAIPSLVKAMQKNDQKQVRDEVAYSLGQIGDESAIPFLAEIVKSDDKIFNTATLSISKINGERGISTLIKLLSIDNSDKIWHVIYGLELLGNKAKEAIPHLIEIANNNTDKRICGKAIYALGMIGGTDVIYYLQNSLDIIQDSYIRFWIALSLARILGRNSEGAKELDKLFVFSSLEHEQISEYRLLTRKWHLDKSGKSHDMKLERVHEEDKREILQKIKIGETKTFEYKSHLRWNIYTKTVNKELKFKITKTIASMMNSEGGQLLIGISNSGEIIGLTKDYETFPDSSKQNRDGFRLHLIDCINKLIGPQFNDLYNISFMFINNKEVCIISIKPSNTPIHVKTKEGRFVFSIRGEGGNQELDSKEMHDYLKMHERFQ